MRSTTIDNKLHKLADFEKKLYESVILEATENPKDIRKCSYVGTSNTTGGDRGFRANCIIGVALNKNGYSLEELLGFDGLAYSGIDALVQEGYVPIEDRPLLDWLECVQVYQDGGQNLEDSVRLASEELDRHTAVGEKVDR